jgi:hypothetical protein
MGHCQAETVMSILRCRQGLFKLNENVAERKSAYFITRIFQTAVGFCTRVKASVKYGCAGTVLY